MNSKIIAVDFDGTLCENKWPEIGEPKFGTIMYLKKEQKNGAKLILWTCRVGEMLENAVAWCTEHDLEFDAVNENLPEIVKSFGSDTRKIFANEYVDDRNSSYFPGRKTNDDMSRGERMELLGRLVDIVEDWLETKGITSDDIPNEEREDTEDAAIIYGSDYDHLADGFAATIGIHRNSVDTELCEESPMQTWAEREIAIACKLESPNRQSGEWDYGCACYESALKALKSLLKDGHSGFSISMTKYILNRLIEGKPLTPIEDTEDIWTDCSYREEAKSYQCKRMGSFFKDVYADGTVKYHNTDRVCCVNIDNPNVSYHNGFVSNIIDEMYPIGMPYFPESKPFTVYCEEFLTDRANGDFDTVGVLYTIKPNGERVEINRFFKEGEEDFIEIDSSEYEMRRKMHKERLENLKKEQEKDCNGCFGAADNDCQLCMEDGQHESE